MKPMTNTITLLTFTVALALLQGCSGYTLQSMIDGDSAERTASQSTLSSEQDSKIVPPSKNSALQSISPSTTASDGHTEHRVMQKQTNDWIKDEWEPLSESNTTTNEEKKLEELSSANESDLSSDDDNSSYTLQHYVDKAGLYLENKAKRDANKTKAPSHVDKINAMPGIGKRDD